MGLKAVRFIYIGDSSTENIRFYQRFIRGFLRWHRGSALWVKGAVAKKEAYLVFKEHLAENIKRMLQDELENGGYFTFFEANPYQVLDEVKELERETKGFLAWNGSEFGNSDEMFCPLERYTQVSVKNYCIGDRESGQKPCPHWEKFHCVHPRRFGEKPQTEPTLASPEISVQTKEGASRLRQTRRRSVSV